MTVQIQFVPSTPRDFLASINGANGEPLAKAGTRGRFGKEATIALDKARAEGFRFIGDEGHPQTEVKVKREKTVTTPAPAVSTQTVPAAPASTHPAAQPASFVAKDVRSWAKANGVQVGERGRIHPSVIDAFVKAGGKPTGERAKSVSLPTVMPQRRETVGYAVEKSEHGGADRVIALTSCGGSNGANGCHKAVSHCKCPTGPVAAHWLPSIAGQPLLLTKPVA